MANQSSHLYVGFGKCGCGIRFIRDESHLAKEVEQMKAECRKDGMEVRRLTTEEAKPYLDSECTHQQAKQAVLAGTSFVPIGYADWRLTNSDDCDVCEGSGKQACPVCLARYQHALSDDRAKWKRHCKEPAFFVTAECASKQQPPQLWQ